MVRDVDMNPCALESWGLVLSNAQELVTLRYTPVPMKLHDWSLWPSNFVQENAVNSGDNFRNFKISTFSNEYSRATVRDIDINPCACESWDLELSHAQGFASIRCTPSSLIGHDSRTTYVLVTARDVGLRHFIGQQPLLTRFPLHAELIDEGLLRAKMQRLLVSENRGPNLLHSQ